MVLSQTFPVEKERFSMNSKKQINCSVYPMSEGAVFPERQFLSGIKPVAVCISGGATRSFSAAVGQVKGLMDLVVDGRSVWSQVDALSCLSGSAWFAAPFYYADASYLDDTLLGKVTAVRPESLTENMLNGISENFIGYPLTQMIDSNIIKNAINQIIYKGTPVNRCFSRTLGTILLNPFNADAPQKYLAWSSADVSSIVEKNASLTSVDFQTARPDRPFLIASSSAVHTDTVSKTMYHFDYTPLYCGTAQKMEAVQLGGGFVQNMGFNSTMTSDVSQDNTVSVKPADFRFTLSDLMGSSGAAPGIIFDKLGISWLMPEFEYWPAYAKAMLDTRILSFVDGGDLEDTAIVPLLMRQHPFIIALVNSEYPLNEPESNRHCVDGINGNISRLFGKPPKGGRIMNNQDTQIFDNSDNHIGTLSTLINGLNVTKSGGQIPYHVDTYRVLENNPFGISPYEPKILWLYNDRNDGWYSRLSSEVKDLMSRGCSRYHLSNFPNYKTLFQNGLEAFSLKPVQIQLLANMWYWSVQSYEVSAVISTYVNGSPNH
jgi:hypothetical protein